MTELFHNQRGRILIQYLVNVRHYTKAHELLDYRAGFDRHLLCKIAYRDVFWDINIVDDFLCRLSKAMLIGLVIELSFSSTATTCDASLNGLKICDR